MLIEQARAAVERVSPRTRRRALKTLEETVRRLPGLTFTAPMGARLPVIRPSVSTGKLREALDGRRVVLTGATSGIGLETARALGRAEADVILVARRQQQLDRVAQQITAAGGQAEGIRADLSRPEDAERVVRRILRKHGGADVLINNAGHSIRRPLDRSYRRAHDFERTMALNYFGAVRLILGFLPGMRERGFGHVLNVSSIGVQTRVPRFGAYIASKAALDTLCDAWQAETHDDGVRFTTVHMPLVRTPMIEATTIYQKFPTLTPEDAAAVVAESIVHRPRRVSPAFGQVAAMADALSPQILDRVRSAGFKMFADSKAARGDAATPETSEQVSPEGRMFAELTRGVHW